ncbi:MAG: terpene cyclase/mutase family protein [Pirellula sp.]|jgi:hypothetical protein|nr:terpene cyclase/mutase family protein [Pirellula sp.]
MIKGFFLATSLATVLLAGGMPGSAALAENYDPEHPFVMNLVKRGVEFLKNAGAETRGNLGHDMIIALAIYKSDPEENGAHPVVARGIQQAVRVGQRMNGAATHWDHEDMYVIPVAAMLLASVSPDKYKDVLIAMRDALLASQRPNGGFGYMDEGPYKASGAADISQTQYIMLAFWTMNQAGIEVPPDSILRCIDCLARAQAGDGGWPYQWGINLPSTVQARSPTSSLTAAGFSAFLIAGDTLGVFRSKFAGAQEEEGIVPEVFVRIEPDQKKKKKMAVDKEKMTGVSKKAENWFSANPYSAKQQFHYYYVYSKERYESFLEVSKGKTQKSPAWYNDMVAELAQDQLADGSWTMNGDIIPKNVSTAFAILFLIRSTQKAIGELHDDLLKGGNTLPDDPNVTIKDGKIVGKTQSTTMDDALKVLESDDQNEMKASLVPDKIILPKNPKERKEYLARFARMMSSKDHNARRFAAKLLGRGDDLEFVPQLIYGLSDPDPVVPRNAEASLRLISRQLDTSFIPKEGKITEPQRISAILQWRKWYLTVRPDYVFID